jgi:hypothetical protein
MDEALDYTENRYERAEDRLWSAYWNAPRGSNRALRALQRYRQRRATESLRDDYVTKAQNVGKRSCDASKVLVDFANGMSCQSVASRNDITQDKASYIRRKHLEQCKAMIDVTLRVDIRSLKGTLATAGTKWKVVEVRDEQKGIRTERMLKLRSGKEVIEGIRGECVVLP